MEAFLKQEFEEFVQKLEQTPSFKDFLEVSHKDLDKLYLHGYKCYENTKYKDAISTFRYLILQNPLEERYWFCLAASLQEEKNYALALRAWAMTCLLNQVNPYPHFHAAECYFSIGNQEQGLIALDLAASAVEKEDDPLLEKIQFLKTCWERSQK